MSDQLKDPKHPSGPVAFKKGMTISIDRDLCIGAATCLAIAPEVFALDDDAKAIILEGIGEATDENVIDAARACPTTAITIRDETGKQIYP
jgi:ferredoxin